MFIDRRSLISGVAGALISAPIIARAQTIDLLGAGGSTIRPIMAGWLELQAKTLGLNVDYQAVGSPTGTTRILGGMADFAILEIPLSDEQLGPAKLYQFPLAFAAIAFVVNIPGVGSNQLALTGQLLGAIYWGKIKKWNDPRIVAVNPGLALPDIDIHPINHAEPGSAMLGDTIAVTSYFLSASPDWQEKYGAAVPKRWAVGSMSATGETVTATIRVLEGSIGYLPLGAATASKLAIVMKRDSKGQAVIAGADSLKAAVSAVDWVKTPNLVSKLVDLPGDGVWPVVIASYGVVPRDLKSKPNGAALRTFFKFALTEGSEISRKRGGEPPPPAIQARVLAQLDKFVA
jgi:phosphate transport system substrate-binding protein